MLLAGDTLYSFLLSGISNRNIFVMKEKENVVVYNNIHDKFLLKTLHINSNLKNVPVQNHTRSLILLPSHSD